MEIFKNPKFVLAAIVILLAAIVFYQNSGEIQIKLLFFGEISTQKATALLAAFLTGAVTGALVFSRWQSKREKAKKADAGTT